MNKIELRNVIRKIMNIDNEDIVSEHDYMILENLMSGLNIDIIMEWPEHVDIEYAANNILISAGMSSNEKIHGSWIHDGKQYVVDGFRILEINNPINLKKSAYEKPFDVQMHMDAINETNISIPVPTVKELKQIISENLKSHNGNVSKINYIFEHGLCLNVEYLLDAITATGATELITRYERGKFKSPCYFKTDIATCMVLPVIHSNNVCKDKRVVIFS